MNDKTYKSQYEGYFFTRGSKGANYYTIGMKSNSLQNFKFKKETYLDKFFKLIGFSKEFQIRDSDFDQKIYIVSDCELFYQDLYKSKKLQDLIMELFNQGIRTIESDSKRLLATFKDKPKELRDAGLLGQKFEHYKCKILEVLSAINEVSQSSPSSTVPPDPVLSKFLKFQGVCGLVLFTGLINSWMDFGD
jgi:hypothetical protein